MNGLVVRIIVAVLERIITPELADVIRDKFVEYLRDVASATDNELDDKVVDIVAKALGVK